MRARRQLAAVLVAAVGWGTAAGAQSAWSRTRVSADALFLAGYTKREDPDGAPTSRTGLYAQSLELHLQSDVDDDLTVVAGLRLPRGSRTEDRVDLGETYLRWRLSPALELTAGRFRVDLGAHNRLHEHRTPFLDGPLALERLFGVDGIEEVGLGLRRRLPTPWAGSLSLQAVNGDNLRWVNPTDEDLLYVVSTRHDWGDTAGPRLSWGAGWAGGRNPTERWTHALDADLTIVLHGWTWQTEYVRVSEDLKWERRTTGGFTTHLRHRVARRLWAQGRYDRYGMPRPADVGEEDRFSLLFDWRPRPELPLRLQLSRWRVGALSRGFNQYHVQLHFSLGPHGIGKG